MKLYVITATNQLTGDREALISPRSYYKSRQLLQKWKELTKDCQKPAWTDIKVEKVKDDGH